MPARLSIALFQALKFAINKLFSLCLWGAITSGVGYVTAPDVDKIDFIAPNLDPQSGLLRVKVLIDNPEHVIKAGMKGWVDFGGK